VIILFKIAVCDDDERVVDYLIERILVYIKERDIEGGTVSGFSSPSELVTTVSSFDLLFLDIEMGNENGILFAKELWEQDTIIPTIFITSHIKYAYEAHSVHPFDYIPKPIEERKLFETLDDFFTMLKEQMVEPILFQSYDGAVNLMPNEILYFQYLGRKDVIAVTTDKRYTLKYNFEEIVKKMEGLNFFVSNKSNLVNIEFAKGIEKYKIVLTDGTRIPLAQKKKNEFYNCLSERTERKVTTKGLIKQ
jgi:DNA-binding LytR/AlgR family response regulator